MEHGRLETIVVALSKVEPSEGAVMLDGVVLSKIDQRERSVLLVSDMPYDASQNVCKQWTSVCGGAESGFEMRLGKVLAVSGPAEQSVDEDQPS